MTSKRRILLSGAGGPTPRSIARSLKLSGDASLEVVGTDCNPHEVGLYAKHLIDKAYVVPPCDDPAYWPEVRAIVQREGICAALIQPELEVLEWARQAERPLGLPCPAHLPPSVLVEVLIDKARVTTLLKDTPYVPSSVPVESDLAPGDLRELGARLGYPFWLRATTGSSGLGAIRVERAEDVVAWCRLVPHLRKFLASTYLPGRNLACKLLYDHGVLVRSGVAERVHYVMSKVSPTGVTGNTSFGRLLMEPQVVALSQGCLEAVCSRLGVTPHGMFTVDLKEDGHGTPRVTEINVRHVAFTWAFAAAGVNFAADQLELTLGGRVSGDVSPDYSCPDYVFLRDVDALPILMRERDLLTKRKEP